MGHVLVGGEAFEYIGVQLLDRVLDPEVDDVVGAEFGTRIGFLGRLLETLADLVLGIATMAEPSLLLGC
jgi:hypothetical protein